MTLFRIDNKKIVPIERTTFAQQSVKERADLQKMLKEQIDIISPDTLVIAEEFGDWEDSRRRIDLLGIDKDANLVVIELKRTEDGGHMELQAIRYAAMISALTFDRLVEIYAQYIQDNNLGIDATSSLLEFLNWQEPDEDNFAQEVKIILASAEFSRELTTSVMWLNDYGLDIRCIRMHPYKTNEGILLDIQKVIPIPEAQDYQVRVREKKQREREARSNSRDTTRFNVTVAGKTFDDQSKRWMIFHLVRELIKSGAEPKKIGECLPTRKFKTFDGTLNADQVYETIMQDDRGGVLPLSQRFFIKDGEFFHVAGKTYILSNQWGIDTLEAVNRLIKAFPNADIQIKPSV